MKVGDYINTPRFSTVKIKAVFASVAEAREAGYTEPTHYEGNEWKVLGKSLDMYHMEFAAARKG